MDSLKEYKKAEKEAVKKLISLMDNLQASQIMEVGISLDMSFSSMMNYKAGKGTNLETVLKITEAIEKINKQTN